MTCSRCGREIEVRTLRPRRGLVVALWALALGLAWWLAGGLLHDVAEGVETSLLPVWKLWVSVVALVPAVAATALMAPNIHEAFDRLKEQGKARFLGVSTHTPNLEEVANTAIDSGRFDVMMLAYHFGMWPTFGHILEKAKQHDLGIVAMKTQPLLCTGRDFAGTDLAIA
jgi:hypothetical protein